ncbi:MAG: outer rane efflux protein [Ferruginibacter sp.]|nr:outer rane efflux protein [Ferruginibacter sp.]
MILSFNFFRKTVISILSFWVVGSLQGQVQVQHLSLKDAVQIALNNYPSIKAKTNYSKASKATVLQTRKEALPNLILSFQQDYGTVNGQNGPSYGLGGFGVASSGLALPDQNWNAGFGALYLTNINWEVFTFGRTRERIKLAESFSTIQENDLQQEQFQQKIKVAAAYLNLLAAQRFTLSQQSNLNRADTIRLVVKARAMNGLIAGVDSSTTNAEVSNARIALLRAKEAEQQRAVELAQLMGVPSQNFALDTLFITKIPLAFSDTAMAIKHPLITWYQSRITASTQQSKYFKTLKYPSLSLFGVFQTRGSGFQSNYATDQKAYNQNYWSGINPTRLNYLLGLGLTWNLTSLLRVKQQVASQNYISAALQNEFELVDQQLKAQVDLAETRINIAVDNFNEVPVQIKAATEAFIQRRVLYTNGLANITEMTQSLYLLNRAETDRDIAYSNVWQALLLKAAATGNFALFINEF